jgi:tRNA threonylcarbamoyladenosine biosynthesis protein TsaE
MSVDTLTLAAPDEAAMVELGAALARASEPGLVIFLHGELGAGKTTLTRGFIQALGHGGAVKSPTYTLVEPYELADGVVYHFDLYRLGDPEELEFMGIHDYFGQHATCLLEWPERGLGVLPPADLVINIEVDGSGRRLELRANSAEGMAVTARLREAQQTNV